MTPSPRQKATTVSLANSLHSRVNVALHLDDAETRASANLAAAYLELARSMGRPWRKWDDLWASDLGTPVALPPNSGTLLRPLAEDGVQDVVERLHRFFSPNPGGGYELWSLWPSPDLGPWGFEAYRSPCMVRAPDNGRGPALGELEIAEVTDAAGVRDAMPLWIESFEIEGAEPGSLCDERALEAWRMWVGYVDGRPVSTSSAFVSAGLVGVYAVATTPAARGKGYGEALSWAATLCDPALPAALQASPLGRPVYERMGYRTVGWFTVWQKRSRRRAAAGVQPGTNSAPTS